MLTIPAALFEGQASVIAQYVVVGIVIAVIAFGLFLVIRRFVGKKSTRTEIDRDDTGSIELETRDLDNDPEEVERRVVTDNRKI